MAIFPASHYVVPQEQIERAIKGIKEELAEQVTYFKEHDQLIESQRIAERTNFDIEMLRETGFCSGIENYSRHLAGLEPGQPPSTLIDFVNLNRRSIRCYLYLQHLVNTKKSMNY